MNLNNVNSVARGQGFIASKSDKAIASGDKTPRDSFSPGGHFNNTTSDIKSGIDALFSRKESRITKNWEQETYGTIGRAAISNDGYSLAFADQKNLTCVDTITGDELWHKPMEGGVTFGPGDNLYVAGRDGSLYCLNKFDGKEKWKQKIGEGSKFYLPPKVTNDGKLLLRHRGPNKNYVVDPEKPQEYLEIKFHCGAEEPPEFSPDSKTLYYGIGGVKAYDVESGEKKWEVKHSGLTRFTPGVGKDGSVYAGTTDGIVFAINPDGTERWSHEGMGMFLTAPLENEGIVYAGCCDDNLYAFDKDTGEKKWALKLSGEVRSTPIMTPDGKTLIAKSDRNDLYGINPATSKIRWKHHASSFMHNQPALDKRGNIYFGTNDSKVYSFNDSAFVSKPGSDGKETSGLGQGSATGTENKPSGDGQNANGTITVTDDQINIDGVILEINK